MIKLLYNSIVYNAKYLTALIQIYFHVCESMYFV